METDTPKPAPPQAAHDLREKLERLTTSPIQGEADAAKRKLNRLLTRYDFSHAPNTADLFEGFTVKKTPSMDQHALFDFDMQDCEIAQLAAWAIERNYGVTTTIRRSRTSWQEAMHVNAAGSCLGSLQRVASVIRSQFTSLWQHFEKNGEADPHDRRVFLLGLYDGIMDDPRNPGQRLPERRFDPRPKKAKRKAIGRKSGVAIHPYTLALDLGRKIRLCASVEETTAALHSVIAGTIEQKAA